MSLKVFHLFFISLCILLCIGFGIWCVEVANLWIAAGMSFVIGLLLVAYESYIIRRLKRVGLL